MIKQVMLDQKPERLLIPSYHDDKKYLSALDNRFTAEVWEYITPELFTIFWLTSLQNISLPAEIYQEQIQSLGKRIAEKEKEKKRERDREANKEIERLKKDLQCLSDEFELYKRRIKDYDEFFVRSLPLLKTACEQEITAQQVVSKEQQQEFNKKFIFFYTQTCLLPRLFLEPSEALFCLKFTVMLFRQKKMKLNECLQRLQEIMFTLLQTLSFLTEQESLHFAIFILEIFKIFARYNDPEALKQDLKRVFDQEFEKAYEKYREFINKMYFKKFCTRLILMKDTVMQVICALTILNKLKEVFPQDSDQRILICEYLMDAKETFSQIQKVQTKIDVYKSFLRLTPQEVSKAEENRAEKKKRAKPPADSLQTKEQQLKNNEKEQRIRDKDREKEIARERQRDKDREQQKLKDKERAEKDARSDRDAKDREADRDAKDRDAKDRDKDRDAKDRDTKDRDAKDRDAKDRDAKDRDKDHDAKDRDTKERDKMKVPSQNKDRAHHAEQAEDSQRKKQKRSKSKEHGSQKDHNEPEDNRKSHSRSRDKPQSSPHRKSVQPG